MTFSAPLALVLTLALPYLVWLGRPARRRGAGREWASLILRCLIVLLLVLGLSGAQLVRAADELAVVYLVDGSDSVPLEERERALQWVGEAIAALRPDDRAALVFFGGDALVERPLSGRPELAAVATQLEYPLHTDLGAALRLGMALLPAGSAGRLVLLSDGVETVGDTQASAQLAAAAGIPIDVYPLGRSQEGPEALLVEVSAPTRVTEGDRFELLVTAVSQDAGRAQLRVLGDGTVVYEQAVSLASGENRFAIPLAAGAQGFARYRVQLLPAQDGFYQNNELAAFTEISGPPRVLLVSPPAGVDAAGNPLPDESEPLARALLANSMGVGLQVERVEAPRLPADLVTLNEYAAVVLVNVNAKYLNPRKMAALRSYVRDLGGGLVAVGGPDSYAPGGYYRTPLEEALPVEMQLKDQERRADLTMIFVIDKSGSMSDTSVGGIPKVELAKEAVIRSLGLLGPTDRVGVVAFDGSAKWVVTPQEVTDPDGMADLVGTIRADGGTDILAGLRAVADVVPDDPAAMKHIVLLTDGGASEAGNPELAQQMHDQYGATLSVVAIGEGYMPWIERLPDLAGGRFHFAYDPDTIPEIFTQETSLATRAYIIEEEFWPTLVQRHPILSGITAVPPLYGYVGTSGKPAAQVILTTAQDDPLLAAWHYGLGKSVAWTSDAAGRWATEWVTWPSFPLFWEQAIKWAITQERGSNAETEVTLDPDGRGVVTVDALSAGGVRLNGLEMEVRLVGPDGTAEAVSMQQVAPGRYRGSFRPGEEGAYLIRVAGSGEGAQVAQTTGWVLNYSPEYKFADPDHVQRGHLELERLAQLTGGKVLQEPWESLAHDLEAGRVRRPIWPGLLLIAALLFPVDVAVRRLVVRREDFASVLARAAAQLPGRRPGAVPARSEQVGRLLQAKERIERPERVPPPTESGPVRLPERPDRSTAEAPAFAPQEQDGTLAGRLLAGKQKRKDPPDGK